MAGQITAVVMGVISLVLAQFTSIPQLIQLKKSRNSSGISLWTYIIFNFTSIFWVVWSFGYYFNAIALEKELTSLFQWTLLPAVIMNVSNIFTMGYVLAIKIIYMNKAKKLHVTELELSKILLLKDKSKYFVDNNKVSVRKYLPEVLFLSATLLILVAMVVLLCLYGLVKIPGADKWTTWVMVMNGVGAVTWEAVSWPQFIKSIREKDTTGVSLGWAIFLPTSCAIMFTYDLTMSLAGSEGFNMGILFSLIFNGMISSFGVLALKIINLRNAKKHGLSEIEYTKKYLIPEVIKKKQAKMRHKKEA